MISDVPKKVLFPGHSRAGVVLFLVLAIVFLASGIFLQRTKRTQKMPSSRGRESSEHPPAAARAPAVNSFPGENWKLYRNPSYRYEVKYPSDWEVDRGNPPDDAQVGFGPVKLFRPLVLMRVVKSSELENERYLLLLDSPILEKKQREIAGIRAEQVVVQTFKGPQQKIVSFIRGDFGFLLFGTQGTEEENTDQVFEQMAASVRFGR